MKYTLTAIYLCLTGILVLFSGCESQDVLYDGNQGSLQFIGEVVDAPSVSSRAPGITNLSRDTFDTKFYMEMLVSQKGETVRKRGQYLIPQQRPGVLRSYATTDSLNWLDLRSNHVFYGWTTPWIMGNDIEDPYGNSDPYMNDPDNDYTTISFDSQDPMYDGLIGKKDRNGRDISNYNCAILENFVGAKSDPVNFFDNGDYVNMQFKHLVSKIYIGSLRFSAVDGEGNITNISRVNGTMTLKGVPSEAVFVRVGENGEGPVLIGSTDPDKQEITYEVKPECWLYICPDVDFSQVEFSIKANHKDIGEAEFLGDFKNVTFLRDENDWWDRTHSDPHKLYAGEYMSMSINLRQGKGASFSITISDWSDQPVREGTQHPYPGIYDSNDLNTFYDTFNKGYSELTEKEMFEKYGDEESGEYKLFEDMNGIVHGVRTGKQHPLNGMGHTITFSQPYSQNTEDPQVRVTLMRDIYLTDNQGYMIYIDKDYNVFTVKPDGNMTPALDSKGEQYRLDPLKNENNAYTINLRTGQVSQTSNY